MALLPGVRLGPYQITAAIGAGGMGEVFRARDTSLNRDVAIKVLPEVMAADPDRLARFRREAQVLASLNHPNIAAIFGMEVGAPLVGALGGDDRERAGTRPAPTGPTVALVMELVEGEDLSERLKRGAIPVDESIAIAKQIADGLEEAHEHGIIHRDLKPANVKVTPDGKVKILDFGLAKALEGDPGSAAANSQITDSPTMSRHMTEAGIIMGTAAYMSPEQARGKPVDKRSDIWSFGVVLFEMLSGTRLFAGETVSDTLAAVLREEIPWSRLPGGTPRRVDELLRRCLTRDPRRRTRDIGEARLIFESDGGYDSPTVAAVAPGKSPRSTLLRNLAIGLLIALVAWSQRPRDAPPRRPMDSARLEVNLGVEASHEPTGRTLAIAPDGSMLAFVGRAADVEGLYIRRMDDLTAVPLAGTQDARHPFFSPDGQWLGFFADGKLKKIAIQGGEVTTLADAPIGRGGSWGDDGNLYFTPTVRSGIARVSSDGGEVTIVTDPAKSGDLTDRWPQILPGSKSLLVTSHSNNWFYEDAHLVVASIETGARQVVASKGYFGRYVASGHLVYMSLGRLLAAPFDLSSLKTTGPARSFLDGIDSNQSSAATSIAFAHDGTMVYVSGTSRGNEAVMSWMDRSGKLSALRAIAADWRYPQFSADGRRILMSIHDGTAANVWIYDWGRDALSRITFESGDQPSWTPDGAHVSFLFDSRQLTARPGAVQPAGSEIPPAREDGLYRTRADGTGPIEPLTKGSFKVSGLSAAGPGMLPGWVFGGKAAWHPDGEHLAFVSQPPGGGTDISVVEMKTDGKGGFRPGEPRPLVASPFMEWDPAFSPDGKFLAYTSDESGQHEVYVRPFPPGDGKWQVSIQGGAFPEWSHPSSEIVFFSPRDNRLMSVAYDATGGSFEPGKVRPWAETPIPRAAIGAPFALHPDGKRVVVRGSAEDANQKSDTAILWLDGFGALRRLTEERPRP